MPILTRYVGEICLNCFDKLCGERSTNIICPYNIMFTNRRARKANATAMYYKNKLNEHFSPHNGVIPELAEIDDIPLTTTIYVDFLRTDAYSETGTRKYPFKTLAAAHDLAVSSTGQKNIVLLSGNTVAENITFSKGHIFLIGENSSGTHAPIIFYGSLTFTGPNTSISENHFAVAGIELIGVSGTDVLTFSGSYPQRLFLRDVWITANGTAHGINMTNVGSGSTLHTNDCKFSHNGSGDYHCINVAAGTANIDSSETSGVTIGVIGVANGTCNITNSDIQSSGAYAIDVYANGVLTLANCKISTTAANSDGIKLMNATSLLVAGNVSFSVPTGDGRAIYGIAGSTLYYGPTYFLPIGISSSNNKINVPNRAPIPTTPSYT